MSKKKKIKNNTNKKSEQEFNNHLNELASPTVIVTTEDSARNNALFYYWGNENLEREEFKKAKENNFVRNSKDKWVLMTNFRTHLASCFFECGYADFKGIVSKYNKEKKRIMFNRLYFEYGGLEIYEGKEDHVNIWLSDKEFKNTESKNLEIGDAISFSGEVYAYIRKNGTADFGVKNIQLLEKIDNYSLPTEEELTKQQVEKFVCENMCMYRDHCYATFCLQPDGWLESTIDRLMNF